MGALSRLSKSAVVFEHDGREYSLSPLELGDLGELERWLEAAPFERARLRLDALGECATAEERKAIIERAEAESLKAGFHSERSTRDLSSVAGTAYILYLSLRRNHPDVTRRRAEEMLGRRGLIYWQRLLDRASGLTGGAAADSKKNGPAGTSRRTGRRFSGLWRRFTRGRVPRLWRG